LRFFEGASGGLDVVDGQPPPAVVAIEEFVYGLAALPAPDGLTRRELEVLRLLAGGHSNRDIATALTISLSTAAKHVNAILTKTGAANRTQAAAYAHRLRLV
jgi:DNA-binding NarL/FixJ family response regulator